MIDTIIEIVNYLWRHKLRTILTSFGVFWGVFMLIIMLGFGNGLKNSVYDGFSGIATNSFFLWTRTTTLPYQGFQKGRRFRFLLRDVAIIKNRIDGVEYIAPRIRLDEDKQIVTRKGKVFNFTVFGDMPNIFKIQTKPLIAGRFFNMMDLETKNKVCVVGKSIQKKLFDDGTNPIGQYIKIYNSYFLIIGVFEITKGGDLEEDNNEIFIPFTTFSQVFNTGNTIDWMSIKAKDNYLSKEVMDNCIKLMKHIHYISPKDMQAIGSFDLGEQFTKIDNLFLGINLLTWIVGLGTLIAGAVGVMNIMLVTVFERTKEIGIKRAIGATPVHIIRQIIQESVFITFFSGYIGLFLSIFILEGISNAIGNSGTSPIVRPGISFSIAFSAFIILMLVGIFAGIIPAKRALAIKPIEALKDE